MSTNMKDAIELSDHTDTIDHGIMVGFVSLTVVAFLLVIMGSLDPGFALLTLSAVLLAILLVHLYLSRRVVDVLCGTDGAQTTAIDTVGDGD